jgi:hypothetical protein
MTEEQTVESLRAVERAGRWSLVGSGPGGVEVVNDYLGYLADRGYSPRTVRAYASTCWRSAGGWSARGWPSMG